MGVVVNRDELLALCFGDAELRQGKAFETLDEDQRNVLSHVDLFYKRVLIRTPPAPGPGFSDASAMETVAAIANVCTDPDHRWNGYARRNIEAAHDDARTHALVSFAALFAGDAVWEGFYSKLGYVHPKGGPPYFYVCPLRDDEWPEGPVETYGTW